MAILKIYDLQITFDDGDTFEDGMEAQTHEQALQLAYWNWEYAHHIEVLGCSDES